MTSRRISASDKNYHPKYVVWELTLKCDQSCSHCGSRANLPRNNELTTKEAISLAKELVELKPKEVVLIGGEAYLHEGFYEIIKFLSYHQILVSMTTGGKSITPAIVEKSRIAGLKNVSISIDGLEPSHNLIRRNKGSFKAASNALEYFRSQGISIAANTNINRINKNELEELYQFLKISGIKSWQIQITTPLGRAADRPNLILQPWDLISLMPKISELKKRAYQEGILIMPGNNLGYFGPEEKTIRSFSESGNDHWIGCQAGKFVMGIESDGGIKGCPSLQSNAYIGGNIRNKSLKEIWEKSPELQINRYRTVESLSGFCRTCPFAKSCLGGCSFTAHSILGKTGNNPFCHFRAKSLAKLNIRERLVLKENAPSQPFDNGIFEIHEEPFDAPDETLLSALDRIRKVSVTKNT
ncbi:radical SAM/SPASM domain-containing protein [Leptospira mtsangambouensis]|uniref:radical SAM/SPASM domain-containing protein n=1 Tax=Leptospira mtsangambouensis TaxID=2484912 RepID=UPI001EEC27C6|nr:radical SAM protein [Leptospira mtsangambouensis]MCG6141339.1 radical SAM protein [Leptospira mtsangambouensis]